MAGVLSRCANLPPNGIHSTARFNEALKSLTSLRCESRKNMSDATATHPIMAVDYQHLSKSKLRTYHFQDSLPRLPLPKLVDSCDKYMRALEPILSPEELKNTKDCVNEFLGHDGLICQQSLVAENKMNKDTSFISELWFDMYLSDRTPLPINYNPFLVFNHVTDAGYSEQEVRASNLIISSLRFYRSLNEEILEPEVYHMNPAKSNTPNFKLFTRLLPRSISWYGAYLLKAFPLDMSQYKNLFCTTRIPDTYKDSLKHSPGEKHIVVMRGGHFYAFDVIDRDGNIIGPDGVLSGIRKILQEQVYPDDFPVGVLTTERRDVWSITRNHLANLGNQDVLEVIDRAMFVLVLDDERPGREDLIGLVREFLHGDGTNRWFDKSFSLIVNGDGTAGINFEHSWGDGVAVLRYFNDIHQDSINKPRVHPNTLIKTDTAVRKLDFKLDDKVKAAIVQARYNYAKTCKSLDVRAMDYRKFGRDLCKPLNISPDAMMQLSFQIAHDQLKGFNVGTYESCSTAAFKHGRTETVRPCTLETEKVCKALRQSSPPSKQELQQMIIECSKKHSNLIKEAAMGNGFDRHLFALRKKAEMFTMQCKIFEDIGYKRLNHNILSTSTLSSDNLQLGAFGPVVPDGFGIAYSMFSDRLGSIVTNYHSHSDGQGFIDALQFSLDKIHTILK